MSRIKFYRRSAPNMEPLVSDPVSDRGISDTLASLTKANLIDVYVDGTRTIIFVDDISYVQFAKA